MKYDFGPSRELQARLLRELESTDSGHGDDWSVWRAEASWPPSGPGARGRASRRPGLAGPGAAATSLAPGAGREQRRTPRDQHYQDRCSLAGDDEAGAERGSPSRRRLREPARPRAQAAPARAVQGEDGAGAAEPQSQPDHALHQESWIHQRSVETHDLSFASELLQTYAGCLQLRFPDLLVRVCLH